MPHGARRWLGPGGGARDELHGHAPDDAPPQGRVLRHVVGHLPAPSLDVPVPQMVDQLPDIDQFFPALCPDPEQVIEVPKILPLDVPMRAALRVTQLEEQLVEVPTTVSYSSLRRTVGQLVDIPVPGGGGSVPGLQGFLPGQSSTAPSSSSKKRISERTVEQIVRFPGEGLQDSRPGQFSPASSSFQSPAGSDDDANEPGDGVFRTFPHGKKVRSAGRVSADLPRHISSWTPAAYEQSRGSHEQEVKMEKKKAEYERRMIVLNQRVADGLPIDPKDFEAWRRWSGLPPSSSYSSGKRRKRKKRRKKKTPKSSSFRSSSGVRPAFARCRLVVVDVFGNMYDKFQQSDLQWKVPPSISSTKWWTFLLCVPRRIPTVQTVQKTVVPTGAVLGQCLRPALVVSALVRHPTLTRSTPSMSCVCLFCVAWVCV